MKPKDAPLGKTRSEIAKANEYQAFSHLRHSRMVDLVEDEAPMSKRTTVTDIEVYKHRRASSMSAIKATNESSSLAKSDLFLDVDELLVDIDKGVLYKPEGAEAEKFEHDTQHSYAIKVTQAFVPVKVLLQIFGRWPLTSKEMQDGSRMYQWKWRSLNAIYFAFVTFIVFYAFFSGLFSMYRISSREIEFINGSSRNATYLFAYEKMLLSRHIMFVINVWTSLFICGVTSIVLICRKDQMAYYFSFWTKAIPTMHMDAAKGVYRFSLITVLAYTGSMIALLCLSGFRIGNTAASAPFMFGMLLFRHFTKDFYGMKLTVAKFMKTTPSPINTTLLTTQLTTEAPTNGSENASSTTTPYPYDDRLHYELVRHPSHYTAQVPITVLGGVLLFFLFMSMKIFMFVYIFYCKLLKNAFAQWNSRAYVSLLRGSFDMEPEKCRTSFILMFRDHCLLLDLLDNTDNLFSIILETYFSLQMGSLCAETYLAIRAWKAGREANRNDAYDAKYFIRPWDTIPTWIMFIQNLILLRLVSYTAASVGEEAKKGMDVLRKRTLIGRRSNDELYFLFSMISSYSSGKELDLSAGKYFSINKELIIAILSTAISFFIIIYQFRPVLDYEYPALGADEIARRDLLGKFFSEFESFGPADHYLKNNKTR